MTVDVLVDTDAGNAIPIVLVAEEDSIVIVTPAGSGTFIVAVTTSSGIAFLLTLSGCGRALLMGVAELLVVVVDWAVSNGLTIAFLLFFVDDDLFKTLHSFVLDSNF